MTEYQKFQLQWMADHSYSLDDLINELEKCRNMTTEESIRNLFYTWQNEIGFSGSIWPCKSEWNDCERNLNHE